MDREKAETAEEALTFEQAFAELQKLVQGIDQGKLTLDDSIAAFEKGVRLAAFCRKRLEEAEGKILKLTADNQLEPFVTAPGEPQ